MPKLLNSPTPFLSICFIAAMVGCAGDEESNEGSLVGTWKGGAGGFHLTVEVKETSDFAGSTSLLGTMSTDRSRCFNNGTMAGSLSKTSVEMLASGAGTASTNTIVQVTGELSGKTITGNLEVTSAAAECALSATPLVLTR